MTPLRASILALPLILALGLGAVGLYANGRKETYRSELAERCRAHVDSLNFLAGHQPSEHLKQSYEYDRDVYIAEHHCLHVLLEEASMPAGRLPMG